jgi:hypothetical protein
VFARRSGGWLWQQPDRIFPPNRDARVYGNCRGDDDSSADEYADVDPLANKVGAADAHADRDRDVDEHPYAHRDSDVDRDRDADAYSDAHAPIDD